MHNQEHDNPTIDTPLPNAAHASALGTAAHRAGAKADGVPSLANGPLPAPALGVAPAGHYRWVICLLLFLVTTLSYMDRQVISILKDDPLSKLFGWTETDYSNIVFAFQCAYALGYLLSGRMMDRLGVRRGLALSVTVWSLAAMAHGLMSTVTGFAAAAFCLGIAEGGNFPAAIKTISEWFPRRERALATGLFNAGSNVGAVLTPVVVPWITLHLYWPWSFRTHADGSSADIFVNSGWPWAFIVVGGLGLVWLVFWLLLYSAPERHPRVTPAELAFIRSDPPDPPLTIGWLELFRYRPTWAFLISNFMTSPIWWFYLFWMPSFLNKKFGVDLTHLGPPLIVLYLMTDVGSIGGGWLSSRLMKMGWSVNAARKVTLLLCALCVVPVFLASQVSSMWIAVLLVGVAASAHQGFFANLFTLVSDTMPRPSVSSVVGIGGMAGAVGGMIFAKFAGYILDLTHSYLSLFAIASSAYLLALLVIQVLVPKIEPVSFEVRHGAKT